MSASVIAKQQGQKEILFSFEMNDPCYLLIKHRKRKLIHEVKVGMLAIHFASLEYSAYVARVRRAHARLVEIKDKA